MRTPTPENFTDQLWRAALTLLVTAGAVYVAWHLLVPVLPALLVFAALLLVLRLAIGGFGGRSDW